MGIASAIALSTLNLVLQGTQERGDRDIIDKVKEFGRRVMDAEELLGLYQAGERDFRAIILQHTDLSKVKLDSVNLSGACFYNVNLHAAALSNVNLSSTEWWDCNLLAVQFCFCNLNDAIIEHSILESASFFDCDLREVNTSGCNLTRTGFSRVNLQGAKLGGFGEDPCRFWDVIRPDGVFIPGFTSNLYRSSHNIASLNDLYNPGGPVCR